MANTHISRMLLQAASCRRSGALRPISTIFSRQTLSRGAAGFHTTAKVGEAEEAQKLSEEASLTQSATETTRRKKKADEQSVVKADAKPRRPRRTKAEMAIVKAEEAANPKPRKFRRTAAEVKAAKAEKAAKPRLKPAPRCAAYNYEYPVSGEVELPPVYSWHQFFPVWKEKTKHTRASVREVDTADKLANAFVPEGSKDMTVIEISAGPGQLTRSLLRLPKERIKKMVVLENNPFFAPWQEALQGYDPRVKVFREDGYDWSGYTKVEESGVLDDLEVVDWQIVHPNLVVVMHLSGDVFGEQLLAQLLRSIPDRQWLFKFGRVPLHVVAPVRMWERMSALPGEMTRCKVSVMAQATAEIAEALPFHQLQPYGDHFHPVRLTETEQPKEGHLKPKGFGSPHAAFTATPRVDQVIQRGELDYWDYCTRKLFVQKATPVHKTLGALGPGANNLLPKLADPSLPADERMDTTKAPRNLDLHEWELLVRAFKNWPFRPESLSIDNFHTTARNG
ncbi:hypothetical protein M413DRAFT_442113 [Hebeloma cylindrosporum]|uniref:rRNA adenine N(6)-methyltransferase n=1 Tax=Hebeloma cylindrosporum TaxID=76867 RepID=A0A0C3CNN1_HEBCY|nr:hypothetical protein M413DRAFT_442113 [Hebeloma cylindrosporum h7]